LPATIITTSSSASGLAMMEIFKLVLDKPTEALLNRNVTSGSFYTFLSPDPPTRLETHTRCIQPEWQNLPSEAFDAKGEVKDEYITREVMRAYPEGHTEWDKIVVPGDLTIKQFVDWLATEHSLTMTSWDFVLGTIKERDPSGYDADWCTSNKYIWSKTTACVYPQAANLDYSLLPSLALTKAQALGQLPNGPHKMQYLRLWNELKASGALSIPSTLPPAADAVLESTTLRQMLQIMAAKADALDERPGFHKTIDITSFEHAAASSSTSSSSSSTNSSLSSSFWVIRGKDGPSMTDAATGEHIEYLASFKIVL